MRSLSLNRKLDAANKAVIKASHMKSSFIQHITHEIRTPLNSIIGFSSLMAAGGLTQEEMEEYARQMESSNAYLLDLVNNVIDIADMDSQTDDIPKKPVSVDACCQECLGLIRQNLKEGIFMAVVNNIKEIREQRGIYQDELAEATGYCTKTIGRIERGESTPSAEFMLRISKYFNMMVEDVFHVED